MSELFRRYFIIKNKTSSHIIYVAVHSTGLRLKNTMLRHFYKDKKHLKIYKSEFFLHSLLEDMFMHQFMQNKNLCVIFDILKLMFYRGKLSKNEGEKENFTQSLYKKSCKRRTLLCFQFFFFFCLKGLMLIFKKMQAA